MVLEFILSVVYVFSDLFYWIKWIASYCAFRLKEITHRRRFDLYDFEADYKAEKLGILIPEEEKALESPFSEGHLQEASDEIFLYGVNSKSECLVVRIARACNGEAEAWLYLKLSDGRSYKLVEPLGYQRTHGDNCQIFSCGGLQMYYLSPMRRWRIVYCGMLRETQKDGETQYEPVFVKFSFIWTASSDIYDPGFDLDVHTAANAMANAKWTGLFPPLDKVEEVLNFYCQTGVVTGTVSVGDQQDIEMYLFGERLRYIGKSSAAIGCKFKHILGITPENGLVVHLGKASVPHTFHNLTFGFIVHPSGTLYKIEDGLIISKMNVKSDSVNNVTAVFKAGKQYELTGNFVGDGVRFSSEHGWSGHLELSGITFEVDNCKGSGFMMSGEMNKMSERKTLKIPPAVPTDYNILKPLTVTFAHPASHLIEVSGGKGSSLGRLTDLRNKLKSFIVPKGIVVTTAAYSEFLTSQIIAKIENLKDIAYGNIKGDIQNACKIVAASIKESHLPDKIAQDIEKKLGALFDGEINQYKFAVRSSATGEDTDQMSAAGQMDTFLGVQGIEEILTAVKKCWASQFSYVAVEYKRQNGQILNSPMAVVIQEMVNCEAAGVLFTCDPVTNNPSVIVITGNYGLGESVVSGSEEPDTIVLKRSIDNEVEIKSVTVGLKQRKIVVAEKETPEGGETILEDVPEDKRNECCISTEIAEQLGKLSLQIEDYYKTPRDIEWGVQNNTIYILQSRPVTTGVNMTDYEIMHEFDGPLRCEMEYFTVCNVGEVLPGATSPLGTDFVLKYFSAAFQKGEMRKKQRNTFFQSKYFPRGMVTFYNHMMLTVIDLITRLDDCDDVMGQGMMIAIFGRILDDPGLRTLASYQELKPKTQNISSFINFLWDLFFSDYGIQKVKKEVFNYEFPTEKCRTSLETFDAIMKNCSHHTKALLKHIACTENSSLWNMYMFIILGKAKGSMDTEVYSDFARLLASSSNVESADVPSAMQDLAHSIIQDLKIDDFKSMTVEAAKEWLETSNTLAGYKYRQFLKRHGHRCLKEFDMHSITWGQNPKPLIKLLQNLSGSCSEMKEKQEEDFSKILSELQVPLDFKSRWLLKFVLPNCRRGVRGREACKSNFIKSIANHRIGYQHLSKKMVAEGFLPNKELLFFLTIEEIKDLLHTRDPRLIARANHRRKMFPVLEDMRFPEISKGRPVPINMNSDDDEEYIADLTMTGIPVSQGTVKGYARVALTLEEAAQLQPGEILITYSTDIGWSPYFPILSGVVTELGGLISHGAVVSREYGLPCVVGLHAATKKFVTGDYVLLDGNKGVLQRLSAPGK